MGIKEKVLDKIEYTRNDLASEYHCEYRGRILASAGVSYPVSSSKRPAIDDECKSEIRRGLADMLYGDIEGELKNLRYAIMTKMDFRNTPDGVEIDTMFDKILNLTR